MPKRRRPFEAALRADSLFPYRGGDAMEVSAQDLADIGLAPALVEEHLGDLGQLQRFGHAQRTRLAIALAGRPIVRTRRRQPLEAPRRVVERDADVIEADEIGDISH